MGRWLGLLALALVPMGCGGNGDATPAAGVKSKPHVCQETSAYGYTVCGYPLQPRRPSTLWTSSGRSAVRLAGPATPAQHSLPSGFWVPERIFASPDGKTLLAQWSGECESQSTYLVSTTSGEVRSILDPAAESTALGWTKDGRAEIKVPRSICGASGASVPGIYAVDRASLKLMLERRIKAEPGGP
jgi:hypothetical protein